MEQKILQLKIALKDIHPTIWRRIEIKDDITFYELHHIIQIVMGWWNSHLFEFRIKGMEPIGITDEDWMDEDMDMIEATELKVSEIKPHEKMKFEYIYDFGDYWRHTLTVEKIKTAEQNRFYPQCTGGERNCPPEDVGGFPGYMHLLEVLKNKRHPDHKDMIEWLGEPYDPEEFDANETNEELQFIIKTKHWNPN